MTDAGSSAEARDLRVVPLTREWAAEHLDDLAAIFEETPSLLWTAENIMYEVPGKWEFSFAILDGGTPIGLSVASTKLDGIVWLHGWVVKRSLRGGGSRLIEALFHATVEAAASAGRPKLSGTIARTNLANLRFCLRLGWYIEALKCDTDELVVTFDVP